MSVAATGGSTNAVLHLLAIAREAGVELSLADFDRISAKTPVIADLKPSGRFVATDLHAAGGVALVARELLKAGLVHGDAPNVDGRSLAEVATAVVETPGQEVVVPIETPLKATGGLAIRPALRSGSRSRRRRGGCAPSPLRSSLPPTRTRARGLSGRGARGRRA